MASKIKKTITTVPLYGWREGDNAIIRMKYRTRAMDWIIKRRGGMGTSGFSFHSIKNLNFKWTPIIMSAATDVVNLKIESHVSENELACNIMFHGGGIYNFKLSGHILVHTGQPSPLTISLTSTSDSDIKHLGVLDVSINMIGVDSDTPSRLENQLSFSYEVLSSGIHDVFYYNTLNSNITQTNTNVHKNRTKFPQHAFLEKAIRDKYLFDEMTSEFIVNYLASKVKSKVNDSGENCYSRVIKSDGSVVLEFIGETASILERIVESRSMIPSMIYMCKQLSRATKMYCG